MSYDYITLLLSNCGYYLFVLHSCQYQQIDVIVKKRLKFTLLWFTNCNLLQKFFVRQ